MELQRTHSGAVIRAEGTRPQEVASSSLMPFSLVKTVIPK